jgi:GT2 family glycosyltransferase
MVTMHTAVVIPVGGGRLENLTQCLESLAAQTVHPDLVVIVGDGTDGTLVADLALGRAQDKGLDIRTEIVGAPKHEPGLDHPRNRGVRKVQEINQRNAMMREGYPVQYVWFLDSDVILDPEAFDAFQAADGFGADPHIMVGPYDFMPPESREPMPDYHQDMRWRSFDDHDAGDVLYGDLSAGLACFSGNLIWPLDQFVRIGGFWNELHHGRCEDGELGLRAVACGLGVSYVSGARGWHLYHGGDPMPTPEWMEWATGVNAIDVPKIDGRHHWLHGAGLFVVEEDGKRFNVNCKCGWSGNTAEIWEHKGYCVLEGAECDSCGADLDEFDAVCPKSKRPCGHHCNHSWSHEKCHWCGKEWGAS